MRRLDAPEAQAQHDANVAPPFRFSAARTRVSKAE
jgi:hypothetical protein